MRVFVVCLCILLCGCDNPYTYKPDTQASLDNQQSDYHSCNAKAADLYLPKARPITPGELAVMAAFAPFGAIGGAIAGSINSDNPPKKIDPDASKKFETYLHNCMADKGYIYHPE